MCARQHARERLTRVQEATEAQSRADRQIHRHTERKKEEGDPETEAAKKETKGERDVRFGAGGHAPAKEFLVEVAAAGPPAAAAVDPNGVMAYLAFGLTASSISVLDVP